MDIFQQIRASYAVLQARDSFTTRLERWGAHHAALAALGDVRELLEVCGRTRRSDFELRDRVLAALCVEARCDEVAKVLVCHMMLSALLDVVRELGDQASLATDDLHGEVLANFWTAVCKVEAETQRVAQRLRNAAKFRTLRVLAHQGALYRVEDCTDRELVAVSREPRLPADDEIDLLIEEAVVREVLSATDARLVRTSERRLSGAAQELGLSKRNGRARRQKAKARLRHWMEERSALDPGR